MLWKLPSGKYINPETIACIAEKKVKGLTGQFPIAVATVGGAGLQLQGKDAQALLAQLEHEGLILAIPTLEIPKEAQQ